MDLFWISRELQFKICNHGGPHASPHTIREGEHIYREEKEAGRDAVNKEFMAFCWLSPCQERRGVFCFLLGSAINARFESSPFWSPDST